MAVRQTRENDSGPTPLGNYLRLILGVTGRLHISVCEGQYYSVCSHSRVSGVSGLLVPSVGFHPSEVDQVEAVPRDPDPFHTSPEKLNLVFFLVAVDGDLGNRPLSCGRRSNFLNPTRPRHRSLQSSRLQRASFS